MLITLSLSSFHFTTMHCTQFPSPIYSCIADYQKQWACQENKPPAVQCSQVIIVISFLSPADLYTTCISSYLLHVVLIKEDIVKHPNQEE